MSEQEYALCPHCSLVNAIRHGAIYCRNCGKNSGALGLPRIPRVDDDVEPVSVDDNFDQYYLIAKCKHCRGLNVVENDQINCHCGVTTEAWAFKAQLFKQIPSMSRRDPEVDMEIGSAGVLQGSKEPEVDSAVFTVVGCPKCKALNRLTPENISIVNSTFTCNICHGTENLFNVNMRTLHMKRIG